MVVEVMGRHAGWIAVMSGIAGGADVILIPEQPLDFEEVARRSGSATRAARTSRSSWSARAASSPACRTRATVDQFGHVMLGDRGVGELARREIEQRTGFETRVTVLGHVQRGGTPTPRDRVLATRFGLKAAELAFSGDFGQMAALRGDDIVAVSLAEATAELKTVPPEWYAVAQAFFG